MKHPWRVLTPGGHVIARCTFVEDVAPIVARIGEGSTIMRGRVVCWTEGACNDGHAGCSFQRIAEVCVNRWLAAEAKAGEAARRKKALTFPPR